MKKFSFSLASVQRYKEQTLDLIKIEYAAAENAVEMQKAKIEQLKESFRQFNDDLKEKNAKGTSITELNNIKQYLMNLQHMIDAEIIEKARLEQEAEKVKQRMIEAKVEAASIEIIRDKRFAEYNVAVQKSEDAFIEEFISSKNYRLKQESANI